VPPGNWWEILSVVGACANAREPASAAGRVAMAPARRRRRVTFMVTSDENGGVDVAAPAWMTSLPQNDI
jgi:hypothetical protein